jgi:hypothetical protein
MDLNFTKTETLVDALYSLADAIESETGLAEIVIMEAAERIKILASSNVVFMQNFSEWKSELYELQEIAGLLFNSLAKRTDIVDDDLNGLSQYQSWRKEFDFKKADTGTSCIGISFPVDANKDQK